MKKTKIKKICDTAIQYHIDRMQDLCDEGRAEDAFCVYGEIRDWIIQKDNLEVISLEYINDYFTDF